MASLQQVPPAQSAALEQEVEFTQAGQAISVLDTEKESEEPGVIPFEDGPSTIESTNRRTTSPPSSIQTRPLSERRTSYVPTISSPLNPSSGSSTHSSEEADTSRTLSPTASSGSMGNAMARTRKSEHLSSAQQMLRQKSASQIKDLGWDYTRYPSTVDLHSPSRNASTVDVRSSISRPPSSRRPRPVSIPSMAGLLRTTTNNPFGDSQADLEQWGYPDDRIGVFDPYLGGEKGFILYADETEADDCFHMPRPDDDTLYNKLTWSEAFNREHVASTIGGIVLVMILSCVFVVLPIIAFTTHFLTPNSVG